MSEFPNSYQFRYCFVSAGNVHIVLVVCVGAAYKCLRPVDEGRSISSGEDGHWGALSDRLLVPVADQLLVHIARSVDSFV